MNVQVTVSDRTLGFLRGTKLWVTFIAVLAFVGTAFMVLASLAMFAGAALAPSTAKFPETIAYLIAFLYLVVSAFFLLVPGILLIRYGAAIGRIAQLGQTALEQALARQKTFWKYAGIFTIVILVIDVAMLIGIFGFGLFHGAGFHP